MWEDEELAEDIYPDVIRILTARNFFNKLENAVFPAGDERRVCRHSYELTTALLISEGFDDGELEDILSVFQQHGGCCDCEILYNVDDRDDGRKAHYWRKRYEENQASVAKGQG